MQVGPTNEKLYVESEQKIPSTHQNSWKIILDKTCKYLFHIPSSTLFELKPDALIKPHTTDSCPLCLFESHIEVPKKTAPKVDISAIALNVVESCNLRCTYCFAGEGDYGRPSIMNFELAKKVINFFTSDRSKLHIVFFGGEPLLNFDLIKKIVGWCIEQSNKHFTFGITTNGVLLKPSVLNFFKKHNFAMKISYDGPLLQAKQRLDTENRAKLGSLTEKKIQRFSNILSDLRSVKIRATLVSNHMADFFLNIVQCLNSVSYQLAFARAASKDQSLNFTMKDVEAFNDILERIVDHYLTKDDFHSLLRISNLSKFIKMIHRGEYHRNFCGAGINYLSVSSSGNFYLCHRFTEDKDESLGNVDEGFNKKKLDEVSELRMNKVEPCRSCWMRNLCGGGCFHEHKVANGDIARIDPLFCLLQEAELEQAIRIYLRLKNEAPELLD